MFLLDTMVLSELRKHRRNPGLVAWMGAQSDADLFISVVTIGEIQRGAVLQQAKDPQFAAALTQWLDRVLMIHGERIVPFDLGAARRWGRLSAGIGHDGADLMIAATALEHGLTVVTRNRRHFESTGVATVDPFI